MATVTTVPSKPAASSVLLTPKTAATGPVSPFESGVRLKEIIRSRLETRPSIWLGTRVPISVNQMRLPIVSPTPITKLSPATCHAEVAMPIGVSARQLAAQATKIHVTLRRGAPLIAM